MRPIAILLLSACVASVGLAQATVRGTVTGPDGKPVPRAPVQAKDLKSGTPYRAFASAQGEYVLTKVPAGTYELSVKMPSFAFNPYVKPDFVVNGSNMSFDIRLPEGANLSTIGDDPYLVTLNSRGNITGKVPRLRNGKPDLSGVWNGKSDLFAEDAQLLPWAADIVKERLGNDFKDTPSAFCLPSNIVYNGSFLRRFVHTTDMLVILNEDDVIGFRQIYLDGRPHPKDFDPTWMGHSIGRWEGETLVVDTVGFNKESWLDIYPHTEQLHLVERFRRKDLGHMEVQIVAEDPGTLTKPWNVHMEWDLAPKENIIEFVCAENNSYQRHVGK